MTVKIRIHFNFNSLCPYVVNALFYHCSIKHTTFYKKQFSVFFFRKISYAKCCLFSLISYLERNTIQSSESKSSLQIGQMNLLGAITKPLTSRIIQVWFFICLSYITIYFCFILPHLKARIVRILRELLGPETKTIFSHVIVRPPPPSRQKIQIFLIFYYVKNT